LNEVEQAAAADALIHFNSKDPMSLLLPVITALKTCGDSMNE